MNTMYRLTHIAFLPLAAVLFALDAGRPATAEPMPTATEVATPNHDQDSVSLMQAVAASMPKPVDEVATPNHDSHRDDLLQTAAAPAPGEILANTVTLRAEPEAAEPPAPAFIPVDTVLYAKANA